MNGVTVNRIVIDNSAAINVYVAIMHVASSYRMLLVKVTR